MEEFASLVEKDFEFPVGVEEEGDAVLPEATQAGIPETEDRSLGDSCVSLSDKWVTRQLSDPGGQPTRMTRSDPVSWNQACMYPEEQEPEKVKGVVSPKDFKEFEVELGKKFFIGKTMCPEEKKEYGLLLASYTDVFAWARTYLRGIPAELGEHQIDLVEGATPVRQRQYRLNPRYSLMVKEEIDRLLEAGFIYPVNNSEWVSPIVVLSKTTGAGGKVKNVLLNFHLQ